MMATCARCGAPSQEMVWSLLKLHEAGASTDQLLSLYLARVCSTLEYSAQVYSPLLNASQEKEIEAVQWKCMQIILEASSTSYRENLCNLGLVVQREELVRSFAISCFRSTEHRWWFTPHPPLPLNTRLVPPRFLVPVSRTWFYLTLLFPFCSPTKSENISRLTLEFGFEAISINHFACDVADFT